MVAGAHEDGPDPGSIDVGRAAESWASTESSLGISHHRLVLTGRLRFQRPSGRPRSRLWPVGSKGPCRLRPSRQAGAGVGATLGPVASSAAPWLRPRPVVRLWPLEVGSPKPWVTAGSTGMVARAATGRWELHPQTANPPGSHDRAWSAEPPWSTPVRFAPTLPRRRGWPQGRPPTEHRLSRAPLLGAPVSQVRRLTQADGGTREFDPDSIPGYT